MSPVQKLKRALVTILLGLARVYSLDVNLTRDAPETDEKEKEREKKKGNNEAAGVLRRFWVFRSVVPEWGRSPAIST